MAGLLIKELIARGDSLNKPDDFILAIVESATATHTASITSGGRSSGNPTSTPRASTTQ